MTTCISDFDCMYFCSFCNGEIFYKHMYIKRKEQAFMWPYSEKLGLPFVNKLANTRSSGEMLTSPCFERKFHSCKYSPSSLGHTKSGDFSILCCITSHIGCLHGSCNLA